MEISLDNLYVDIGAERVNSNVVLHFGKIETCNVCVCFHRQRPFYDKEKSNPN